MDLYEKDDVVVCSLTDPTLLRDVKRRAEKSLIVEMFVSREFFPDEQIIVEIDAEVLILIADPQEQLERSLVVKGPEMLISIGFLVRETPPRHRLRCVIINGEKGRWEDDVFVSRPISDTSTRTLISRWT